MKYMGKQNISITQNGIWAGSGRLVDGRIECPAILGDSQEAAEAAYDAIEEALEDGLEAVEFDGHRYEWSIWTEDE